MNILDLPEEVVLHIFSHFSAHDLGNNIAKVCTVWREYAYTYHLWKHLDYAVEGK